MIDKKTEYDSITKELSQIYRSKNEDYGDSFGKSIKKHGLIAAIVRIEDKISRFQNLSKGGQQNVKTESIEDTLLDLANYSIMSIVEMGTHHNKYDKHEEITESLHFSYSTETGVSDVQPVQFSELMDIIIHVHSEKSEMWENAIQFAFLRLAEIAIEAVVEMKCKVI